jgi:trans-aconitate methyltransferase
MKRVRKLNTLDTWMPETIFQAQTHFSKSSTFQIIQSKNWKQNKYDLIFSEGVFHHIPHDEHKNLLMELFALLNPNGKLVVWEHNPLNPFTRKIVNDCTFDQDAVLIYPYFMKRYAENPI